jgi:preprotein translocase subunit SecA
MLDRASLEDRFRELWREIRSDHRPVIAPYPERTPPKPWKWDRPLDKAIGKWLVDPPLGRSRLLERAQAIADGHADLQALGEEAFGERCLGMRARLMRRGLGDAALADECFALIREASRRELGLRHFPVQLMGGLVMLGGGVAEMATGEGKTITALLPAITAALAGIPAHVFTVNDYLATRDLAKLEPVYRRFGLTTGLIVEGGEPPERHAAYLADVVYGTNKEIAFDYLRDRAAMGRDRGLARRLVAELGGRRGAPLTMRGLHFAIVDEADSIFIDEARTPLILSAEVPADDDGLYLSALELAGRLEEGTHFKLKEGERAVELTERGRAEVSDLAAGLPQRMWRIRQAREQLATQALSATRLFLRDRDYVVMDGKVQIVDESTGRTMADRSWEGGLHQLVEVKEQVDLTGARTTLARITYQRFFRRYRRLAGMSGTVREVAGELWADFGLRVTPVPTNRPCVRTHRGHLMVRDQAGKWAAVAAAVARVKADGGERPVLVGTRSVADSESVAAALAARGIAHRVLNARQDGEEAEIIAAAGHPGAVTVATNMAGRGTDIELSAEAKAAGGLHVILTAFHETQRIDRQLYGRAGRQGDPGSAEAVSALDDELYRHFAPGPARMLGGSGREWPLHGGAGEWLRKWAQGVAERRHAAARRQTELSEENLRKAMAFSGAAE